MMHRRLLVDEKSIDVFIAISWKKDLTLEFSRKLSSQVQVSFIEFTPAA